MKQDEEEDTGPTVVEERKLSFSSQGSGGGRGRRQVWEWSFLETPPLNSRAEQREVRVNGVSGYTFKEVDDRNAKVGSTRLQCVQYTIYSWRIIRQL